MLERFRAVRDRIELGMGGWLKQPEVELGRLREQREQERLEQAAGHEREAARVGGAAAEGWDPFRRA